MHYNSNERTDPQANPSKENLHWAKGTQTDASDENTALIDSAQFSRLLSEISTSAPMKVKAPKPSPTSQDSDLEVTRVQFSADEAMVAEAARVQEDATELAVTEPRAALTFEEQTVLASPPDMARSTAKPVPLSYQEENEHTAILSNDQRQAWLDQNSDNTAILSLPQVQQWLSNPSPSPLPAEAKVEVAPQAAMEPPQDLIAEGTFPPTARSGTDEDLFALPQQSKVARPVEGPSKLVTNSLLGLFAVIALVVGLAFALPAKRAAVQERIFPTPKPPTVTSVSHAKAAIDPAEAVGAKKLDTRQLMSKAAAAVTEGRRAEALKIYQELAAAYPSVPLYANLVHALKVSEARR